MDGNAALPGARQCILQAVALLQWLLPQPTSYASYLGFHLRKKRLESEIAEFDFRLRMTRGRAATLDEMCCVGSILITSRKSAFPTVSAPLDQQLIVNAHSFDLIAAWVEERMTAAADVRHFDETNSNRISTRRSQ